MRSIFKTKLPVIKGRQPLHTVLQYGVLLCKYNDEIHDSEWSRTIYTVSKLYEVLPGLDDYLIRQVKEGKGDRCITKAMFDYLACVSVYDETPLVRKIWITGIDSENHVRKVGKSIGNYDIIKYLKYLRLVNEGNTYKFYKGEK